MWKFSNCYNNWEILRDSYPKVCKTILELQNLINFLFFKVELINTWRDSFIIYTQYPAQFLKITSHWSNNFPYQNISQETTLKWKLETQIARVNNLNKFEDSSKETRNSLKLFSFTKLKKKYFFPKMAFNYKPFQAWFNLLSSLSKQNAIKQG